MKLMHLGYLHCQATSVFALYLKGAVMLHMRWDSSFGAARKPRSSASGPVVVQGLMG
jgi:hypothetical protein